MNLRNAPLTIKLFGRPTIEKGERPVTGLVTQKAEVLLAYLACDPGPHSRELLATMLWDDRSQKQGLSNLRTLLTSLRRHLGPYLAITRQTVALDWTQDIWVDVVAFEEALGGGMGKEEGVDDPSSLEEALSLYSGDFLEGIFVNESRDVEEWMAVSRERLRQMAIWARERLAIHYLHHRRYPAGILHARHLVALDPLREGAQRLLMRLLARDGQRNAALAQYKACRRLLQEELGVAPAGETSALYRRISRARIPPPHRLPIPPTPFVGRVAELATISRRLDDGNCRLLTLIGPGGAGKTRLALQAADERRGDYLDGIFFVNLAPVTTARALPVTIAGALDLALQEKQSPRAQLLNQLREREILLLLDNFEHLLAPDTGNAEAAVELVRAILEAAPDVKLLVTSRHRLHLRAEWLFTVGGLQTPGSEKSPDSAAAVSDAAVSTCDLSQFEAAQLFTACARRVQSDFRAAGETSAVAHICRLVEGLPLGIELAAASLPQHTPAEIAGAIQHNLDFLASGLRDVPARHRSLRAAFAHSWALLTDAEQQAFSRLAVFCGSFSGRAARSVARAPQAVLDSLVAKSLLRQQQSGCYDLHQSLRHYAMEKLAERPAVESATRDRHSTYLLHFLQQKEVGLLRGGAGEAFQAIVPMLDDVRAAWRRAAEQRDLPLLADSVAALVNFYSSGGLAREGQRTLQGAIDQLEGVAGDEAACLLSRLLTAKARLLVEQGQNERAVATVGRALTLNPAVDTQIAAHFQAGRALWRLSRYDEAQTRLERALALDEDQPSASAQIRGDILRTLGIIAMHLGDYDQAEAYYSRALQAAEAGGSPHGEAIALNQFGRIAELKGNLRQAQRYYEQALPHFRESAFRRGESAALINLGNTLRTLGQYAAARDHLRRALAITREIGDRYQEGLALFNLGVLHRLVGEYDKALSVSEQALLIMRQAEHRQGEANSLYALSNVMLAQGALEPAERLCREALAIYRVIDSPQGEASALNLLGRITLRCERYDEARSHFEAALSQGRAIESRHLVADTLRCLSYYYFRTEQPDAALAQAREALALAQKIGIRRVEGEAWTTLGHTLEAHGDLKAAQDAYRQAAVLRRESGQDHLATEPMAGLARVALAQNRPDEALAWVEEILSYLADHTLHGPEEPLQIYETCQRVLEAVGDPRATEMFS